MATPPTDIANRLATNVIISLFIIRLPFKVYKKPRGRMTVVTGAMLCTHRQVALIAVAGIAPQLTDSYLRQSGPDVGHTRHFSAFVPLSAIRCKIQRSGWLLRAAAGQGAAGASMPGGPKA